MSLTCSSKTAAMGLFIGNNLWLQIFCDSKKTMWAVVLIFKSICNHWPREGWCWQISANLFFYLHTLNMRSSVISWPSANGPYIQEEQCWRPPFLPSFGQVMHSLPKGIFPTALPNREYVHSNSEVIILNNDQHQHQKIISTNNRINWRIRKQHTTVVNWFYCLR